MKLDVCDFLIIPHVSFGYSSHLLWIIAQEIFSTRIPTFTKSFFLATNCLATRFFFTLAIRGKNSSGALPPTKIYQNNSISFIKPGK